MSVKSKSIIQESVFTFWISSKTKQYHRKHGLPKCTVSSHNNFPTFQFYNTYKNIYVNNTSCPDSLAITHITLKLLNHSKYDRAYIELSGRSLLMSERGTSQHFIR